MKSDTSIIAQAEAIARQHMDAYQDVSHDWYSCCVLCKPHALLIDVVHAVCRLHVQRVRDLALKLARSLAATEQIDMLVVEIAALFHDM